MQKKSQAQVTWSPATCSLGMHLGSHTAQDPLCRIHFNQPSAIAFMHMNVIHCKMWLCLGKPVLSPIHKYRGMVVLNIQGVIACQ